MTSQAREKHGMDNVTEEKPATEIKPKDPVSGFQAASVNKFDAKRMANKQRKKRAHRRKLRRSHTKG